MPIKPSKRKTKRSTNPTRHSKNRLQALPSIKNQQLFVVGALLIVALGAWMISRAFATTYVATPQTVPRGIFLSVIYPSTHNPLITPADSTITLMATMALLPQQGIAVDST